MKNTLIKDCYPEIIGRIFLVVMLAFIIVLIVQSCAKDEPSEPGSGNVTTGTETTDAIEISGRLLDDDALIANASEDITAGTVVP